MKNSWTYVFVKESREEFDKPHYRASLVQHAASPTSVKSDMALVQPQEFLMPCSSLRGVRHAEKRMLQSKLKNNYWTSRVSD